MFNNMKQAYNISTELLHILNNYNNGDDDLYHVVVQKGMWVRGIYMLYNY